MGPAVSGVDVASAVAAAAVRQAFHAGSPSGAAGGGAHGSAAGRTASSARTTALSAPCAAAWLNAAKSASVTSVARLVVLPITGATASVFIDAALADRGATTEAASARTSSVV